MKDFDPQNPVFGLLAAINVMTFWLLASALSAWPVLAARRSPKQPCGCMAFGPGSPPLWSGLRLRSGQSLAVLMWKGAGDSPLWRATFVLVKIRRW